MKRMTRVLVLSAALSLAALLSGGAYAQEELPVAPAVETVEAPGEIAPAGEAPATAAEAPEPIDWNPIAASGIGVLTMLLVQIVKRYVPRLDAGVKQVLALVAAPLLTWAASAISTALGHPVDFSSLVEAILLAVGTGLASMGAFDVLKNAGALKK
jgi:hypothetical protein